MEDCKRSIENNGNMTEGWLLKVMVWGFLDFEGNGEEKGHKEEKETEWPKNGVGRVEDGGEEEWG